MISLLRPTFTRRILLIAAPLAVCLALFFPGVASAHAILLRSDPAADAVLRNGPPSQVRMWFSEDLNPAFSTAQVVNAKRQRVDNRDAHVSPSNSLEMDVSLQSNLPPGVYIVVWRTDSANDGHILLGSFIFKVTLPDGSVPTLSPGTNPGAGLLGGNLNSASSGQLDAPTFFNFVMITLVELGAVFWVGAQLWMTFVLQPSGEDHQELRGANSQMKQRFERLFSLPTLVVLFLANIGVIVGQSLILTGGQVGSALAPSLLIQLATSGRFGTFWTMREIAITVALILAIYIVLSKSRSRFVNTTLPWINLGLGLALFIAITMSGHAAAVKYNIVVYSIVLDWLHLLAAALWVGGMMFIATTYLPVLRKHPMLERTRSLVTILPYYSPWALAGVFIMAVSGPFNADFHLTAWNQFFTTAYGRALAVKILLVGGLLLTSAFHVGLLRPRLKKEYKKYSYVAGRLQAREATIAVPNPAVVGAQTQTRDSEVDNGHPYPIPTSTSQTTAAEQDRVTKPAKRSGAYINSLAQQVKRREGRLAKGTQRLMQVLRWEPLLGVGVLVCVGLMNVFGGTIPAAGSTQQQQPAPTGQSKPFEATVKTSDAKFLVTLNVNPNRFGTNVFTVTVVDSKSNKATTNVGVALYTTMTDMDMGTQNVNLLPDGKGHFSASGDLTMAGNWEIRIQIRTPDNTLHEATVKLLTPF